MSETTQFRWDDDLEGVSREIAASTSSPLRVVAGPGAGKTFSLKRRVARLLQENVDPEKILITTYTRTAANDLKNEISSLGVSGSESVRAGTLHSLSFSILSRSAVLQLTGRTPRPLLQFEEKFMLEDLRGSHFGKLIDRKRRLKAFNAAWARQQNETPGAPQDPGDAEFSQQIMSWLGFHKAILIGELIPITLNYLRNNPACVERRMFDHVLVDEYQDLNRAEQILLDLLSESASFTIIGDEDQSIYVSLKHAHPEGIVNFRDNQGVTDKVLQVCKRCPQQIVHMANSLICHNRLRQPRTLTVKPENPPGEIQILQWTSPEQESNGIARIIKDRIQSHQISPGDVLILSPRRQLGYAIRDELNNMEVPAHSFFHEEALDGNPKVQQNFQAQEAFTLLTILANPDDIVALRSWCGFGSPSLNSNAWNLLRIYCENNALPPYEALSGIVNGSIRIANTRPIAQRFRELQERATQLNSLTGNNLLNELFPSSEPWTNPFRLLIDDLDLSDLTAQELRDTLRTNITQPELPTDVDYVRVMSLHKSKGLTSKFVVVIGCIQGLIPGQLESDVPAEREIHLEEQRRLFYVAITRAKETLMLSSFTQLPRDVAYNMRVPVIGGNRTHANTIASDFFSELGASRPNPILGKTLLPPTS